MVRKQRQDSHDGNQRRGGAKPEKTRPADSGAARAGRGLSALRSRPADRAGKAKPMAPVLEEPEPSETPKWDFPIVGIGASAGGLEAFTQVLRALPADTGMAFVVVQHLAPNHKSMLTELLSTATRMKVEEVRDGMKVLPNRIYVIPPNSNMGICRGVLHLVPRSEERGHHMPIDFFLRSLAEEQKGKAIGVILSGTASDGAVGLKAIKAEGGITLAQAPEFAKYDGMPRSAIAAGVVDFVLSTEGIAAELTKIGRHPYVTYSPVNKPADLPEAEDHLNKVFFILKHATGVDFTYYKHATIKRRLRRRMVLQKIERLADYVKYLHGNGDEVDALYQDILIHVTGFFRDPETFETLKEVVFEKIYAGRTGDTPIRIWVPGCSTGEEAYSIAIALLEFLGDMAAAIPINIFATDISQQAIERARVGLYPETIPADVGSERLRRFFTKSEGGYRITKTIRDMCIFARQDVAKDPPFSKLDLISCRNVLIYLGAVLQKRVLTIFHYALKPTGFLLLGNSETIGSLSDLFALADRKHKIYAKKSTPLHLQLDFSSVHASEKIEASKHEAPVARPRTELQNEVDRLILDKVAPARVVINAESQVVHVCGQTGKYLQPAPGEASLNVVKMAREGLAIDLRTAIHAARKTNQPIRKEGIIVKQNGGVQNATLEVLPLDLHGEKLMLLLFCDQPQAPPRQVLADSRLEVKGKRERRQVQELEQELRATRDYLQSIIQDQEAANEELQSANEESLSANEELQSTNEELETAKEELQSTNEELNTVNEELQTRNQELSKVNSDVTNLLASVQIPIVMVGGDLKIRRFTPVAERLFNLIHGDVGRPIDDIKSNFNLPDLSKLIAESVDSMAVLEKEVEDASGHAYVLRVRPYRTIENKIDGAVLVLLDIDAVKRSVDKLRGMETQLLSMAEMVRAPVLIIDSDLRVRRASRLFLERFGAGSEPFEGKRFPDLRGWNREQALALGEQCLEQGQVQGFEIEYRAAASRPATVRVNARQLEGDGVRPPILLLVFDDSPPANSTTG